MEAATPTQAATDVLAERERQKSVEKWNDDDDDVQRSEELAMAASVYASPPQYRNCSSSGRPLFWPWSIVWWKPSTRRRDLVKAGALILAEIERIDRAETKKHPASHAG